MSTDRVRDLQIMKDRLKPEHVLLMWSPPAKAFPIGDAAYYDVQYMK